MGCLGHRGLSTPPSPSPSPSLGSDMACGSAATVHSPAERPSAVLGPQMPVLKCTGTCLPSHVRVSPCAERAVLPRGRRACVSLVQGRVVSTWIQQAEWPPRPRPGSFPPAQLPPGNWETAGLPQPCSLERQPGQGGRLRPGRGPATRFLSSSGGNLDGRLAPPGRRCRRSGACGG